jgi:uncharacterized phage-associated protein
VATAHDVTAYILSRTGALSATKLHKLVYYSQAWHLVWDDQPLFGNRIEAWANGPVVPDVHVQHRGEFTVEHWPAGDSGRLLQRERESVDAVLKFYGDMTAHQLAQLTQTERPWAGAREHAGVAPMERSSAEITPPAMHEYYLSIYDH